MQFNDALDASVELGSTSPSAGVRDSATLNQHLHEHIEATKFGDEIEKQLTRATFRGTFYEYNSKVAHSTRARKCSRE